MCAKYGLRAEGHFSLRFARRMQFVLEMETRAWLACHGFPLVEVWRGARLPVPWATKTLHKCIGSFRFAAGHAATAVSEREEGPRFDRALARRLARELPGLPKDPQSRKSGQFLEGFVDAESFACLLDRVCRRAPPEADILRRFVDLGSGRGHAVLAAHCLFAFRSCVGCEIASDVMAGARAAAALYEASGLAARAPSGLAPVFVEGDFLTDFDWSDASVVFANAVTWPRSLIQRIAQQALRLRKGAVLVTAVRALPVDEAPILEAFDLRGEACLMSFQVAPVQLWAYQRL